MFLDCTELDRFNNCNRSYLSSFTKLKHDIYMFGLIDIIEYFDCNLFLSLIVGSQYRYNNTINRIMTTTIFNSCTIIELINYELLNCIKVISR